MLAQRRFLQHNHTLLNQAFSGFTDVNPLKTLDRGYAIVRDTKTQNIVVSSQFLSNGDKLTIKFAKGAVNAWLKK